MTWKNRLKNHSDLLSVGEATGATRLDCETWIGNSAVTNHTACYNNRVAHLHSLTHLTPAESEWRAQMSYSLQVPE